VLGQVVTRLDTTPSSPLTQRNQILTDDRGSSLFHFIADVIIAGGQTSWLPLDCEAQQQPLRLGQTNPIYPCPVTQIILSSRWQ